MSYMSCNLMNNNQIFDTRLSVKVVFQTPPRPSDEKIKKDYVLPYLLFRKLTVTFLQRVYSIQN